MRQSAPAGAIALLDKARICWHMRWKEADYDGERGGWLEFLKTARQLDAHDSPGESLEDALEDAG